MLQNGRVAARGGFGLSIRVCLLSLLSLLSLLARARADEVVLVPRASEWRFLPGLAEASLPDTTLWTRPEFDDGGWELLPAPLGFSDGPFGTDLSLRDPPMRESYSSIYLRRSFEVLDPREVFELHLRADYDDGFAVWINGAEVFRENVRVAADEPLEHTDIASRGRESGQYVTFAIEDPASYLVAGENVLAIQAFNVSIASNDFKIDVELADPFGPDKTPPSIRFIAPGAGTTVRELTGIQLAFDEPVRGVDARDLLVSGTPAASLSGSGAGPYVFSFPPVPPGSATLSWAPDHGIRDLARAMNAFAGGSWSYTVDPDAPPADLVIHEILASNLTLSLESIDPRPDWIEIYNRGSVPADLGGWSLSDDPEEPHKWVFPNVVIAPGEYLLVLASGLDIRDFDADGFLHASFRLDAGGEFLGLYSADVPRELVSAFTPAFPEQRGDISYGLDPEGRLAYFDAPTPGSANSKGMPFLGIVEPPRADRARGFYTARIVLALSSPTPESSIRYTLDGSWPSPESGTLYEGPFEVAGTPLCGAVTARAVAFRDGYLPSSTITFTYLFPDHVLAQPPLPPGFPPRWGSTNSIAGDYEMDPEMLSDPDVRARAMDGILSIPTLSLVLDMDDLFGTTRGIYANPNNEGILWERAASAELIYGDGKEGFQIDCGLRIQGGSSTSNWKSPKLSMRIIFRGDYGKKKLVFPVFPDSPVERFDTLVLDAGLNLVLSHPDHGQRVRLQYVRDQYVSDLQLASGNLAPRGVFVNLYLNGLYWGLYNVHERPDASFLAEHLGGHKSEYDAFRHTGGLVVDGTAASWGAMATAVRAVGSAPGALLGLDGHLDLHGVADYMIANFYTGNTDWAHHNWYAGRLRAAPGTFRFFSWDAEHTLKSVAEDVTGKNDANSPTELHTRLRPNPEYRVIFGDHVERHFAPGGMMYVDPESPMWDPDSPGSNRPASLYMERIREIDTAVILECARWGDHYRAIPYTRDGEWLAELRWLLDTYFPARSRVVLAQFQRLGLYPRVAAPRMEPAGGDVAAGTPLALSIPAGQSGAIYFTIDGSDPRVAFTGEMSPFAFAYSQPFAIDASRLEVNARTLADGSWSALSTATFYVPELLDTLAVTEIMYRPTGGSRYEFLELHNSGSVPFDLSGSRFTRGIEFTFADGTVLEPGTFLVLVEDSEAFADAHPGIVPAGQYSGNLANGGERLALEDPSGRVLLSLSYDDEGLWPLAPDGLGFSLVRDFGGPPESPESWRASSIPHGSPGWMDPPLREGAVVVHEVLAGATEPLEDAIELHNPGPSDIDIGGWFLSDSRDSFELLRKFRIPDGTVVPGGGFRVFYRNELAAGGGRPLLDGKASGIFLASVDARGDLSGHITGLELDGAMLQGPVGRVRTSTGAGIAPLAAQTFGVSSPRAVKEFRAGSGAPNAAPAVPPISIHEIHYHPAPGGEEFLELHNASDLDVPLHDDATGRGWRVRGISRREAGGSYEFPPGATVPARGYLLLVRSDPETFRARFEAPGEAAVAGPFGGALDNGGEGIALLRPAAVKGDDTFYVLVDRVRYADGGRWPESPDGSGPSLERVHPSLHGDEPESWAASLVPGGTPGALNSIRPAGGNEPPAAYFVATPLAGAPPLEVTFDASGSTDSGGAIADYEWDFGDGTTASGRTTTHTYTVSATFEAVLRVTDGEGAESSYRQRIAVEAALGDGGIVPGDDNLDGDLTVSDAMSLLIRLFAGAGAAPLPCEGEDLDAGANAVVLDINGDASVNLSDPIFLLRYLFQGGAPPPMGTECVTIPGCPGICR